VWHSASSFTQVTNASFAELGPLLAPLHKLDLSECQQLKAISNLAPATSLRELTLAHSRVVSLQGLEKLVALEILDVTNISTTDLSILRQCPHLGRQREMVTQSAKGDLTAHESIVHAAAPFLIDCCLHIDRPVSALDSRSLSCLRRCTVLKFRDLDNASLQGLEEILSQQRLDLEETRWKPIAILLSSTPRRERPRTTRFPSPIGPQQHRRVRHKHCWVGVHFGSYLALQRPDLEEPGVDDVPSLAGCRALRELKLAHSLVTDVGIIGLERVGAWRPSADIS
jgi:hypothetical protein